MNLKYKMTLKQNRKVVNLQAWRFAEIVMQLAVSRINRSGRVNYLNSFLFENRNMQLI